MAPEPESTPFGPWNPGITSTIPGHLKSRVTLFDPRHSFVDWPTARELSDITGLKPQELAVTRPERLALHSVLIRVTSQLSVPDGPNYADLGISLRAMAAEICEGFVTPAMDDIRAAYETVRTEAETTVEHLLEDGIYGSPSRVPQNPTGVLARVFSKPKAVERQPDPTERAMKLAGEWQDARNEDMVSASRRAIARVLSGVLNTRGALLVDRAILQSVAVGLVMNRLGSAAVGSEVQRLFAKAVDALGYRWLPAQDHPVVLNAKGASASGKSTIRPAQRRIAEAAGIAWGDFAIISPDYWRKALIDYDALGDDAKYGAMLCGQELEAIDRKLDILMAVKGLEGSVPHMLIDRFRFDSFRRDRKRAQDSTLLTRFGARVFLFFLITPPAATVERAWLRAQETGRYKAVDDLLDHNIEAYTGMPDLFFDWALGQEKWVHYEFLDNAVPKGTRPRTVAYGQNGRLVVTDLERICDIDRFRDVDVGATRPEDVLASNVPEPDRMVFVRRAIRELPRVDFLIPGTTTVFAQSRDGAVIVETGRMPEGFDPAGFGEYEAAEAPLQLEDRALDRILIGA